MPPKLLASQRALLSPLREKYVCSNCIRQFFSEPVLRSSVLPRASSTIAGKHPLRPRSRNTTERNQTRPNRNCRRGYANGSLESKTAINSLSAVAPAYKELHQRLLALQEAAGSYVDWSRVQLAARSLETTQPIIRVGLLGLGDNGVAAARKLARLLLSDPLGEHEGWEKVLMVNGNKSEPILLKYGNPEDGVKSNELVRTMLVPSRFLERHNLEILITAVNSYGIDADIGHNVRTDEALLVPSLPTPTSAGGRFGFVRYPVHKAVVVAEGITGLVEYGRFRSSTVDRRMVTGALNLPRRPSTSTNAVEEGLHNDIVDLDQASSALDLFRADHRNGPEYSSRWQTSHLAPLSEWITNSSHGSEKYLNPDVSTLIESTLSSTEKEVREAEVRERAIAAANTTPEHERVTLQTAVSSWVAEAHADLQINLGAAITSPLWRRTAWWRLFWRIDDISISAADVLRRTWLTEAEQDLAFLSGKIVQAGLATEDDLKRAGIKTHSVATGKDNTREVDTSKPTAEALAEFLRMPLGFNEVQRQTGLNPLFDPPWPQTINLTRQYLIHKVVPNLHIKAQALLFTSLSTIGGSVALGTWFYIVSAGLALYESGAVIALGTVWSLRRLQRRWSKERDGFVNALHEGGRAVLQDVEGHLKRFVEQGGRAEMRPEDVRSRMKAQQAVDRCRDVLRQMQDRE